MPDEKQYPISMDSKRITQAISILIENAISYTPTSTKIILLLENVKNHVQISIIDHSPGINASDKPHIFKRFYRIDSARHDLQHYGLGLSIAYEVIKLHQGKLSIVDTPDGGATFTKKILVLGRFSPVPNYTFNTCRFPYTGGFLDAVLKAAITDVNDELSDIVICESLQLLFNIMLQVIDATLFLTKR